jgi:anti-sigma B factor antagonist
MSPSPPSEERCRRAPPQLWPSPGTCGGVWKGAKMTWARGGGELPGGDAGWDGPALFGQPGRTPAWGAGEEPFRVLVDFEDRAALVQLSGELDMSTCGGIYATLARLAGEDPDRLVIDLRGVTFMDSTGLRALLDAHGWAARRGWQFALVRGPHQVQRVFEIVALDGVLAFVDQPEHSLHPPRPAGGGG